MIPEAAGPAECHLLFVYGTLRRGFELHHHMARLGARFLTKAKVAAELFDRGPYPGARPSSRGGRWVRGELFQLRQPARDLRVLDRVEECIQEAAQRGAFHRARTAVILYNGARKQAWIYWLGARKFTGVVNG